MIIVSCCINAHVVICSYCPVVSMFMLLYVHVIICSCYYMFILLYVHLCLCSCYFMITCAVVSQFHWPSTFKFISCLSLYFRYVTFPLVSSHVRQVNLMGDVCY